MQAIFQAKCTPCHMGSGTSCSGGRCFASAYDTLILESSACAGTTAECVQERIKDGSMPRNADCEGDPAEDEGDADCLTAEEHALLDAWIAAGALEAP